VALALLLGQNEKSRGDGDSITGKDPNEVAGNRQTGEEEQALRQALAALEAHPEDVNLAAELGHELIWRQRPNEAVAVTERALSVDPFHLENRIHQAALGAFRGDPQGALRRLQHFADTYPDGHEALLFLGSIYIQLGDQRHALESFERFAAQAPASEQPPGLQQGIAMLRQQLGIQP
jgi:tetratricopeptide (TPR) repeat protein